jgi:hypothetical protein
MGKQSASSAGGTVLYGGCGAHEFSVVLEGAAKGWRTPQLVPAERVVARPQVALPPSILRKCMPPPDVDAPSGWMVGYVALLPDASASTPLGAMLRSRALASLQAWLPPERT